MKKTDEYSICQQFTAKINVQGYRIPSMDMFENIDIIKIASIDNINKNYAPRI